MALLFPIDMDGRAIRQWRCGNVANRCGAGDAAGVACLAIGLGFVMCLPYGPAHDGAAWLGQSGYPLF
ncbi:hypothetical protein CN633_31960 [Bacillus toyonensis]|nr:hypothetical protein CN633_31960 [Bacillus toyonensis]